MSKLMKTFIAFVVIAGSVAMMPGTADAQWRGHGWHGGGWHSGWHGGWHGGWGRGWGWRRGWGWGPAVGLGIGVGSAWGWGFPYGYYASYYEPAPRCGSVRVRVWRHGYSTVRRVWRCWY